MNKPVIALFGGSFNPPHTGHAAFVEALAQDNQFDRVWVLPCANHAFGKELAGFEHRFQMCSLAFSDIASHVEIRREETKVGGSGYTIELIRYLKEKFPEPRFSLVLGSDNYEVRDEWKDFDIIEQLVDVQFYGRKGWEGANKALEAQTPFPEISSSEIREKLASGDSVEGLVPEVVQAYIRKHRLYER